MICGREVPCLAPLNPFLIKLAVSGALEVVIGTGNVGIGRVVIGVLGTCKAVYGVLTAF